MRLICVFQGGGAKLVTLLAAAEILEEMGEEINVCEVAGTSAGSVVAAAMSFSSSVKETRESIKKHAADHIAHFSRRPHLGRLLWSLVRGRAIYDEQKLRQFFRSVFPGDAGERLKLNSKSLRLPLTIRTTDVPSRDVFTHTSEEKIDLDLALANSCAIPFAIRKYKSESHYIDGGLLSNLVEPDAFKVKDAFVLAFSFEKSPAPDPTGLLSYLGGLLSTVIDRNVNQSVEKIKIASGAVCLLPNHFGTFEFQRAFEEGLSDEYLLKHRAEFRDRILNALAIIGRRIPENKTFPRKLIDTIVKDNPYSVVQNSTVCVLNTLVNPRTPDQHDRTVIFAAKGTQLSAFKIGLARSESFDIGEYTCVVKDRHGNVLDADTAILQSSATGEIVWHFCVLLETPLKSEDAPVTVSLTTNHLDQMKGLREDHRSEWMRIESSLDDEIDKHDFVIFAPAKAGKFTLTDLKTNLHRAQPTPSSVEKMRSSWSPGNEMTEIELAWYAGRYGGLMDFKPFGWRVVDMKPTSYAGTLIER